MEEFKQLTALQDKIGYKFSDETLLHNAFTHISYANEKGFEKNSSNQRLEYLGDAVLELIVTSIIYMRLPDADEGVLSGLRASLVCTASLAEVASSLSLGDYIALGKGAELDKVNENPTVLEDAFEALVGAVFIDGGYEKARVFVCDIMADSIENALEKIKSDGEIRDAKSLLQIELQKNGSVTIDYRLIRKEGPPHDAIFYVDVYLANKQLGSGSGPSKKEAEQAAARDAIHALSSR